MKELADGPVKILARRFYGMIQSLLGILGDPILPFLCCWLLLNSF